MVHCGFKSLSKILSDVTPRAACKEEMMTSVSQISIMDQGIVTPAWNPSARWDEAEKACIQSQPGLLPRLYLKRKKNKGDQSNQETAKSHTHQRYQA